MLKNDHVHSSPVGNNRRKGTGTIEAVPAIQGGVRDQMSRD
jgi:hypothetical protein